VCGGWTARAGTPPLRALALLVAFVCAGVAAAQHDHTTKIPAPLEVRAERGEDESQVRIRIIAESPPGSLRAEVALAAGGERLSARGNAESTTAPALRPSAVARPESARVLDLRDFAPLTPLDEVAPISEATADRHPDGSVLPAPAVEPGILGHHWKALDRANRWAGHRDLAIGELVFAMPAERRAAIEASSAPVALLLDVAVEAQWESGVHFAGRRTIPITIVPPSGQAGWRLGRIEQAPTTPLFVEHDALPRPILPVEPTRLDGPDDAATSRSLLLFRSPTSVGPPPRPVE
jgi:hypothetical protein